MCMVDMYLRPLSICSDLLTCAAEAACMVIFVNACIVLDSVTVALSQPLCHHSPVMGAAHISRCICMNAA